MIWIYGLLVGISFCIIWQDIQSQTISVWCLVLYGIATGLKLFFEPNPDAYWPALIILFSFMCAQGIFIYFQGRLAMGWGDLVLSPMCGLWINIQELPSFYLSIGIIGILMGLIWHYRWGLRTFPFMPAILGGQGVVFLIRCFLKSNGI